MPETTTYDFIIIGSGMAGLAAARLAVAGGRSVCVLDKGRRIGGRVSTRRAEGFTFNHGAQFLTARQEAFITVCAQAEAAGALSPWQVAGRDAFCGAPTMRDLPAFIGDGLNIRQQAEVASLGSHQGTIICSGADGELARGHRLVVTAPAPQAARLLTGIAGDLAATAQTAAYAPCWTGMYGFDESDLPAPAAPTGADSGPVGWACWEASRPTGASQPNGALIIQAAPDWSAGELERDPESIAAALLAAYQVMIGETLPTPRYAAAHRWRYARVTKPADEDAPRLSHDGRIAIAGDWVAGARVEDAFMSGHRAMTTMLATTPA